NKSLGYFGWLMDMDYENYNAELWLDKDTAIHYLEIELQRTFTDREVNLYKKLIEFLAGASEKETGEKVVTFLTPYFHVVWESVCNFIFSGAHDEDVLIPRPFWNINNKKSILNRYRILYSNIRNRCLFLMLSTTNSINCQDGEI